MAEHITTVDLIRERIRRAQDLDGTGYPRAAISEYLYGVELTVKELRDCSSIFEGHSNDISLQNLPKIVSAAKNCLDRVSHLLETKQIKGKTAVPTVRNGNNLVQPILDMKKEKKKLEKRLQKGIDKIEGSSLPKEVRESKKAELRLSIKRQYLENKSIAINRQKKVFREWQLEKEKNQQNRQDSLSAARMRVSQHHCSFEKGLQNYLKRVDLHQEAFDIDFFEETLSRILHDSESALGHLCEVFRTNFLATYGIIDTGSIQEQRSMALSEVNSFRNELNSVCRKTFVVDAVSTMKAVVESVVFETVSPYVFKLLEASIHTKLTTFGKVLDKIGQVIHPSHLEIPEHLWLGLKVGGKNPYQPAFDALHSISHEKTPGGKLKGFSKVLHAISNAINSHTGSENENIELSTTEDFEDIYREIESLESGVEMQGSASTEQHLLLQDVEARPKVHDVMLGADDLLPIVAYCICRSNAKLLPVECEYCSALVNDDAVLSGEDGYALATLQTAVDYVCTLS